MIRRSILLGLGATLASPVLARAGVLMPVKAAPPAPPLWLPRLEGVMMTTGMDGLPARGWTPTTFIGMSYGVDGSVTEVTFTIDRATGQMTRRERPLLSAQA